MLRGAISGLAAALLCAPCLQAQPFDAPPEPPLRPGDMLIGSVTLEDLRLLAETVEARIIEDGLSRQGTPYLVAQLPSGLTFGAYTVCANEGSLDCRGIEFGAVFNRPASAELVDELDRAYVAISVQRAGDQAVHASRYVILDHGITWANLVENLKVFELLCHHVMERLTPTVPALPAGDSPQP